MVYKVCSSVDWCEAKRSGTFYGSPDDRRDGFIHLSTADQLAGTLEKHFSGPDGRGRPGLLLIAFEADALGSSLRWETARNGALFPHLYAPLPTKAAVRETALDVDAAGRHILDGDFGRC
jgi:uncharacterized protein (DUF952 family)